MHYFTNTHGVKRGIPELGNFFAKSGEVRRGRLSSSGTGSGYAGIQGSRAEMDLEMAMNLIGLRVKSRRISGKNGTQAGVDAIRLGRINFGDKETGLIRSLEKSQAGHPPFRRVRRPQNARGGVAWSLIRIQGRTSLHPIIFESIRELRDWKRVIGVIHPGDQVHRVEQRLHHHLTTHPEYQFSDLVVHRVPNGVLPGGTAARRAGRDAV